MNKLFEQYGRVQAKPNQQNIQNGPFASMNQFFDKFGKFKQSLNCDPNERLQQLLNSGQMSQDQYIFCYGLAKKIMNSR